MATFSERLAYVLTFDTTSGVKSLQKFGSTADKELSKADKKSQKFFATTEKASAGMVAMAGVAGVGLAKMAMGALDTQQNVEALRQVVGDVITEDMEGWAEGAADAIGLSKAAAVDSATAFAQLGKMAGFSGEGLATMSTDLVELGADFAAFKNVSPEKAVQDIRSAFSGSVEVMRKYGIFLDDLTLKAAFFRETGHKVTGTMTGQQKVIAVNAELYRQGADMIGQFGRESATLAGQLPILKANLRNISDAVGAGVLPALTGTVTMLGKVAASAADANPELLKFAGAMGTAGVAALASVGSLGLVVTAARRAMLAFRAASIGMRTMALSSGALGAALVVAGAIYSSYASKKAEAAERTREFVAALKAEKEGQSDAVNALLASKFSVDGFQESMDALGVSMTDVVSFIQGGAVPALDELMGPLGDNASFVFKLAQNMGLSSDELQTFRTNLMGAKTGLEDGRAALERSETVTRELTVATEELNKSGVAPLIPNLLTLEERQKAAAEATEAAAAATKAQAEAHEEAAEAIGEQMDAQMALTDETWAARIAAQNWAEVLEDGAEALAETEEGSAAYLDELFSQTSAAMKAAQAQQDLAETYAESAGQSLTASESLDIWNGSMLDAARSADGPLKASLIEAIALKNDLTEEQVMEILAVADVDAAAAELASTSATREAMFKAVALTAAADEQFRISSMPREVLVTTRFVDPGPNPYIGPGGGTQNIPAPSPSTPASTTPPPIFFHDGGHVQRPSGAGTGSLRGDEVPAVLQAGEYVMSRDEVNAAESSGGAAGVTVQFTGDIYGVPSDEFVAEIAGKLNKYAAGFK